MIFKNISVPELKLTDVFVCVCVCEGAGAFSDLDDMNNALANAALGVRASATDLW